MEQGDVKEEEGDGKRAKAADSQVVILHSCSLCSACNPLLAVPELPYDIEADKGGLRRRRIPGCTQWHDSYLPHPNLGCGGPTGWCSPCVCLVHRWWPPRGTPLETPSWCYSRQAILWPPYEAAFRRSLGSQPRISTRYACILAPNGDVVAVAPEPESLPWHSWWEPGTRLLSFCACRCVPAGCFVSSGDWV